MRDEHGRFVRGTTGNPGGRPKKDQKYYRTTVRSVSLKDWKAIVLRAVSQAKEGNKDAREFLANYIMGKPEAYINLKADVDIELSFDEWEE